MVKVFSSKLDRSLASRPLPSGILHSIESNKNKLASRELPSGIPADTAGAIRALISRAFIFGFRFVMLIRAGLPLASAAVSWLMISAKAR
jgi:hypothetical protein